MKKYINIVLFLIVFARIFSVTLSLKEKIFTKRKTITLQDIVIEETEPTIANLVICNLPKTPYKIDASFILNKLFDNNKTNINIIGDFVVVYSEIPKIKKEERQITYGDSPLEVLKRSVVSFVNQDIFKINITIIKSEPKIELSKINSNFRWEFPKVKYGLKDLSNLKKVYFFHNDKGIDKKYTVALDISILADVWITNKSFQKNDFFQPESCTKTTMDISLLKDIDEVVYKIEDTQNTKVNQTIGAGEILRWNKLTKKPIVLKNETLKLVRISNSIKISLPVKVMQDGFLNEKIEVKLKNGNRVFGVLKKNREGYYVEML